MIEIDSQNECAPIAHMVEFRGSPAISMIREHSAACLDFYHNQVKTAQPSPPQAHNVVGQSADPYNRPSVKVHVVHANFFETMELPIQLGRGLSQRDDANASRAVVINQALARRFFSGENPVGKRLRLGLDQSAKWEIVGVARDAKYGDVCHNRALANCRGIAGLLDSGAAGDEGGSDGRAPL